jgi:hypothetical protein
VVERLSVRDREDPAAQIFGAAEAGIGPQRRDPRLLIAVIGVDPADCCDQEAVYVSSMGIEQRLERRKPHWDRTPRGHKNVRLWKLESSRAI